MQELRDLEKEQRYVTRVVIETELGLIEVELDDENAPLTSGNFLQYVDDGFYNGCSFYRTVTMDNQPNDEVKIEVIQGGNRDQEAGRRPPIALERTSATGLRHLDGTISMGRFEPDSAHSEFFICIGDQPELDFGGRRYADGQGFAAFGQVISGMDVVRNIQAQPAEGQFLNPEIAIRSIQRSG